MESPSPPHPHPGWKMTLTLLDPTDTRLIGQITADIHPIELPTPRVPGVFDIQVPLGHLDRVLKAMRRYGAWRVSVEVKTADKDKDKEKDKC